MESKRLKKEKLLKEKEERKILKDRKKVLAKSLNKKRKIENTETQNNDKKRKGKINTKDELETENEKPKNEFIGTNSKSFKIKVLNNIVVKPEDVCFMCNILIFQNKIECSSCFKKFHLKCIPKKHHQHLPDEVDMILFVCHFCFTVNDDSESVGSESSTDSVSSVTDLYEKINNAKKNLFF